MARTSRTMLNESGENGHPCLVLDLREKVFSSSLLSMMLDTDLSHMAFIMLKYFLPITTLLRYFIINRS